MPKKQKSMPAPNWSEEQYKISRWCADNNIRISPLGILGEQKWKVGISIGDNYKKVHKDKFEYDGDQIWDKVAEYQLYYYNKYKDDRQSTEA